MDLKRWDIKDYNLCAADLFTKYTKNKKPDTIIDSAILMLLGLQFGSLKRFLADNGGDFAYNRTMIERCTEKFYQTNLKLHYQSLCLDQLMHRFHYKCGLSKYSIHRY